jgi:hypothetical protein
MCKSINFFQNCCHVFKESSSKKPEELFKSGVLLILGIVANQGSLLGNMTIHDLNLLPYLFKSQLSNSNKVISARGRLMLTLYLLHKLKVVFLKP